MSKYAWIVMLMALASPAAADNAIPDLLGTWKGESQSIVLGGSPHHPGQQADQPRLTSVAFTLVIDKQDGRRFSGTFSSARHSETVIAVYIALQYDLYGRRRRLRRGDNADA
jgi:hypothetical protein